jgi:ATP-dependent exoDNAse (exonuclease V) beta subunit
MSSPIASVSFLRPLPPDQQQREQALDPTRSVLVQAPAGSGKTDLLTRRYLCLLAEVAEPDQIVAITFTNVAAAEMRHRILGELEKAANRNDAPPSGDAFSMEVLARRALAHSQALGWQLLDLPAQLRISTIDAFCRELALQQPLLSSLGSGLGIAEHPAELYRRAARQALQKIDSGGKALSAAIESLLLWRDNGWQEMEELLVTMLGQRDRWMRDFVLDREPDWEALERPFAHAVRARLTGLEQLFDQMPQACEEALLLARFACANCESPFLRELAELPDFPIAPFSSAEDLEDARQAYLNLADLLLTGTGSFRKQVNVRQGFPADRKHEKARLLELIKGLHSIEGLEAALASVRDLPPVRYSDEDWQIVQACFILLRQAAAELQVIFAEAGQVDFIEIAQIAQRVLRGPDGLPTDAALAIGDKIHHLLVDEFQDTSRRQHQLLASLIAAWPERTGRSCFVVGDPMQSIYFFRDADAELFPRVKEFGWEIPGEEPLLFDFVPLQANFRTSPALVGKLNQSFSAVFAQPDGSGIEFSAAIPIREETPSLLPRFELHLEFSMQRNGAADAGQDANTELDEKKTAQAAQVEKIVALIQSRQEQIEEARRSGTKYRIAVLGRARSALAPIAAALREAGIPFRAVDLEKLAERPEVLDALALARALFNGQDRVAWLGLLRAPWCGLALDDLHRLTSDDDPVLLARPIPELLAERLDLLSESGRIAAARVLRALHAVPRLRANLPTAALGTWLEGVWISLGGDACVDAQGRANLNLLWNCLDHLSSGEKDLLGPVLDDALKDLTALPDPAVSSDCGVQLMTMHKSKGLEFEVVIVPELQARGGGGGIKLLSWLERGLARPDDESGAITEFLIAPLQSKGRDAGKAKTWVDRAYRSRESQEMRRILYVSATRAREELHCFAQPGSKIDADGNLALAEPANSLLATAWPAFEKEVQSRFEAWKTERETSETQEQGVLVSLAASGESETGKSFVESAPARPTLLRRLPPELFPAAKIADSSDPDSGIWDRNATDRKGKSAASSSPIRVAGEPLKAGSHEPLVLAEENDSASIYARHEGGIYSRALGTAVHSLLEDLAGLRAHLEWEPARQSLCERKAAIAAQARAVGIDSAQSTRIAAEALDLALRASRDPMGAWILSPRNQAASELRWTTVVRGQPRTVQVDRLFRAGTEPLSEGEACWWIVDYKTASDSQLDPAEALPELRKTFAPQLEAYAKVLRKLHGKEETIRAGLYYPRLLCFDWWEI